jgi:hypothetical protein
VRFLLYLSLAFILTTCAPDYKDLSNPNGRQALIDLANNYLTAGSCEEAINTIQPLVESQYVTLEARMVYASAYACKGGMSFISLLLALKDVSGDDVWSPLVKSNYSTGSSDGKTAALNTATEILRQTATPANSFDASARPDDANMYMIFVQANIIATVIGPLGAANRTTGKRTQAITATASTSERCFTQVAIAAIADSLQYVSTSTAIDNVRESVTSACGGSCPTNRDYSVCVGNAGLQTIGQTLLTAISGQWSTN